MFSGVDGLVKAAVDARSDATTSKLNFMIVNIIEMIQKPIFCGSLLHYYELRCLSLTLMRCFSHDRIASTDIENRLSWHVHVRRDQ